MRSRLANYFASCDYSYVFADSGCYGYGVTRMLRVLNDEPDGVLTFDRFSDILSSGRMAWEIMEDTKDVYKLWLRGVDGAIPDKLVDALENAEVSNDWAARAVWWSIQIFRGAHDDGMYTIESWLELIVEKIKFYAPDSVFAKEFAQCEESSEDEMKSEKEDRLAYEEKLAALLRELGLSEREYMPFKHISWDLGHAYGYDEVLGYDDDFARALVLSKELSLPR